MPKRRAANDEQPIEGNAGGGALTMQRIAEIAGVSAMTVSRALRGDGFVSRPTRERVLSIVARTGYVPDASARVFASRRSGFVAALVPSLNNSNFADTVRGMSECFDAAGLQMLLGDTQYSLVREENLIRALLQRRPEAIVLTGGTHTARTRDTLLKADIPIVETWDWPAAPLGHWVGFSNEEAGAEMARHLYRRGRRKIAFIGGATSRDIRGEERRVGYLRALRELRLPRGRAVGVGKPPVSMGQAAEALGALLEKWPDTDAIVCVSDLTAFGVLAECQRRGVAVPDQIALVGFGDFEIARCCFPRLTTTAVDCYGIGRRAAEIALEALDARRRAQPFAPVGAPIEFRILERETT